MILIFILIDFLKFLYRQPEIIYDWMICSFTISLSYPWMHPLTFFSFLLYVLCSVTNSQQLLTIPIVYCYLCPSFFKNNRAFYITFAFCFWNTFISKISQKWFQKHSEKYFLIVIVPYISRILLCVTSPLEVTSF